VRRPCPAALDERQGDGSGQEACRAGRVRPRQRDHRDDQNAAWNATENATLRLPAPE
jgi:hypothetical protein